MRRGGWVLVVTPEWRAIAEFDGRGRIYRTEPRLAFAHRRHVDLLKKYMAKSGRLLNWEEYSYGR